MRWSLLITALVASPALGGQVLTNYNAMCGNTGALGPAPGEEGHLAAVRITTFDVPFEVMDVRVRLHHGSVGDAMCDASGAHTVRLWKSTSETPDASPAYAASVAFGTEETLGEERLLEAALDAPIVLGQGEYLWVAVDFGGEHPNVGCVNTCRMDASEGLNFWSNGDSAPYAWSDLATTSANGTLWVEVTGNPPAGVLPEEEVPAEEPVDTTPVEEEPESRGRRGRRDR